MEHCANIASAAVPTRDLIPEEYTWAVEDLYPSDSDWEKDLKKAEKLVEDISRFKGRLSESAERLLEYLKSKDELDILYDRLFNYAERKTHEDTRDAHYQDYYNQALRLSSLIHSATAFSTPEILAIAEDRLQEFYEENAELKMYEWHIAEKRKRNAHTLSEEGERLLAAAEEMANAPTTIMATFTNADLRFPEVRGDDGNLTPLTMGRYFSFMKSKDRDVRKHAFTTLHNRLSEFKNTSASIFHAQANQLLFHAKARNYESSLEHSLDEANVPVSVYMNLINTVRNNLHYMHKYVALRKKLLKLDTQHIYDLSVPLVQDYDCKVPFAQAKEEILEALAPLGEEYLAILREGFEHRWIDVYENEGKFGGAYSTGTVAHPYVMLNYKDTLTDEFILAHEMGHAIHSYLSNKHQPRVYSDYVVFVAEVASTCNEALLMEYLLKKSTDKRERAYLINYFLEQFKGTLFRQAMLAEFEMEAHEMAAQGKTLTAEVLNDLYYKLNCDYYGPDLEVDPEIAIEWSKIPHFYYNFYIYQYATGYSAAMALYRKILDGGQTAVKNYMKFLSRGCSDTPIELLKIAGVDMTTPEPIDDAMQIFGQLIEELDELLAE